MEDTTVSVGNAPTESVSDDSVDKSVKYETHQKLLSQRKNDQAKIQELQAQMQSFMEERKQAEEAKLHENEEYKKLVEIRTAELEAVKSEKDQLLQSVNDSLKLNAFVEKLPGKIKNSKYLSFVNIDDVVLSPDTREVDAASLDVVVSKFMEEHADLVDTGKVGKLPSNAGNPTLNTANLSPDERLRAAIKSIV